MTASVNPITYRGYYFDWATGLYYLQSRYYDPALRRFISADVFLDTGVGILGTNMYAYCNNDPVNFYDPTGFMRQPQRSRYEGSFLVFIGTMAWKYGDQALNWAKKQGSAAINWAQQQGSAAVNWATRAGGQVAPRVPELGRKLDFMFGQATGRRHNLERSTDMLRQLNRIGIFDNATGRGIVTDALTNVLNDPGSIVRIIDGYTTRESLLVGPNGLLHMTSVWQENSLISVILQGG
ncbi:MAG: hypothetical protein FWD06_08000 [Oscillospiraceae bacterium]|nr:hypothetical protein [Oscillospiraceae bacterium]